MSRKRGRSADPAEALPPDLGLILQEIEKEPVPEKLLTLALQLQEALVERRRRAEVANAAPAVTSRRREPVKQPQ